MVTALLGIGGTIAGVLLGWWLSHKTARDVAREEREWHESQTIRERQETAAGALREAVIEAQRTIPQDLSRRDDAASALFEGHRQLREAWTRASLLRNDGIERCFTALDMALFIAQQSTNHSKEHAINFWPLSIALVDMRKALDAYLRREDLPQPVLPSPKELIRIAGSDRNGIEQIRLDLVERGVYV